MAQQSETSSGNLANAGLERTLDRTNPKASPSYYQRAWRRFRKDKVAMASLVVAIFLLIFSFGAPVVSRIAGYSFAQMDLTATLLPPGEQGHLLGTDAGGRDIMVRLAYGGRNSMMVALLAVFSALTIGAAVGSIAGYFGGIIDSIMMRFVDVIISVPAITILLLLSVWFRPGPVGLAFVIAGFYWTSISRLVRGEVLTLKNRDYIDAARVSGASSSRIIMQHIFPNIVSIIIVWMSLALPSLILYEATLSYLGFGVTTPEPSWGNMLDEAQQFYRESWTYVFFPGFAIYLASLAFNLVGNGLRDALDPRLSD